MPNKLGRMNDCNVIFQCPGCKCAHRVVVNDWAAEHCWEWNGSMTAPTFHPSYLITTEGHRCHSYIRDGEIQFLGACDHELAGQTVALPDWDASWAAATTERTTEAQRHRGTEEN